MTVRVLQGDCRAVLATLPSASVHCIVTSPPYYGLRDYGTAKWEGGDHSCDHRQILGGNGSYSAKQVTSTGTQGYQFKHECKKCGARRTDQQIGLEQTPEAYVAELVAVFRDAWRVLRDDGTLWLNLGDSYASSGKSGHQNLDELGVKLGCGGGHKNSNNPSGRAPTPIGLKPKDLLGVPWRVAFALQADGWYLRQDIIWAKPNPMPESVTDRCTKAHEYVFLLSKSARYWYDAEAISEPFADERQGNPGAYKRTSSKSKGACNDRQDLGFLNSGCGWNADGDSSNRNRRSVWKIASQPYGEAHFATMPPDLAELCIKAGCPKGGTVLDPFGGAGTTGVVADRLGRNAVLIELNPTYAEMARRRIEGDGGMFAEVLETAK